MKNDLVTGTTFTKLFVANKRSKYKISNLTKYFYDRLDWLLSVTRGQGEVD